MMMEDSFINEDDTPCDLFCEMCEREVFKLTKHHLIPQTRHRNKKNKKNFDRKEVKQRIAWICRDCHGAIHAFFTNKQLEYDYNTLEKLLVHPEIQKFLAWVKKIPPGSRKKMYSAKNKNDKG